jgi:hypothetical protein
VRVKRLLWLVPVSTFADLVNVDGKLSMIESLNVGPDPATCERIVSLVAINSPSPYPIEQSSLHADTIGVHLYLQDLLILFSSDARFFSTDLHGFSIALR